LASALVLTTAGSNDHHQQDHSGRVAARSQIKPFFKNDNQLADENSKKNDNNKNKTEQYQQ